LTTIKLAARRRRGGALHRKYASIDPSTGTPRGFPTTSRKLELDSVRFAAAGYDPLPCHGEPVDMIDLWSVCFDVAERMGLIPVLREAGYSFNWLVLVTAERRPGTALGP
jgi:hypothetical protein